MLDGGGGGPVGGPVGGPLGGGGGADAFGAAGLDTVAPGAIRIKKKR